MNIPPKYIYMIVAAIATLIWGRIETLRSRVTDLETTVENGISDDVKEIRYNLMNAKQINWTPIAEISEGQK